MIARLARSLGPLGERNYRLLLVGQASSFIGDGMVPVAISFAVLRLTGSVADVGIAMTAHYAPLACFLIVGGVFADRLPRRLVMVTADLVRFASQGLLAALLLSDSAHLSELLLLQAVHGTATAFFNPAVTGLVSETVSRRELQQANALRLGAQSLGNVVGPAIAGVLVAAIQAGAAIAADAGTFAISAACLSALSPTSTRPAQAESFLRELRAGWSEFRSRRWLISANVVAALVNALVFAPFMVVGPAIARAHLGGSGAWGLILAFFGLGAIGGGLLSLRVRPRRPLLVSLLLVGLFAIPLALLALHAQPLLVALAAVFAGGQLTLVNTLWETTLQRLVPTELLSRVVAYDWLFALAFTPIGYTLAGVLAGSVLGLDTTLWLAVTVAVALAVAVPLIPDIRRLQVEVEQ